MARGLDARDRLMQYDLIAYRPWRPNNVDGSYQVLSLPPSKPTPDPELRQVIGSVFRRIEP